MQCIEALQAIQKELKAKESALKSNHTTKAILDAVKPLLQKHNALLALSDEITEVGGRVYVKATAEFTDGKNGVTVAGIAREPEQSEGENAAEITGTTSSYARNRALCGLFLLDYTDIDKDFMRMKDLQARLVDAATVKLIRELITATNSDGGKLCKYFRVGSIEEMTAETAKKCLAMLRSKQQAKKAEQQA